MGASAVQVGPLRWGFGAMFLLALLTLGLLLQATGNARRDATQMVFRTERGSYLLGHIGQQVARLRANVFEAVAGPVAGRAAAERRAEEISRSIVEDSEALKDHLSPELAQRWARLEGYLTEMVDTLDHALDVPDQAMAVERVGQASALSRIFYEEVEGFSHDLGVTNRETLVAVDRKWATVAVWAVLLQGGVLLGLGVALFAVERALKRTGRKVDAYVARIESINKDLDAFAGRIAHDLKNILTPVVLSGRLLERQADQPRRVLAIARRLDELTRRAETLLDGLLAFARAEVGREDGARADVRAELRHALRALDHVLRTYQTEVVEEIDPLAVVACPDSLVQIIFINLVGNAAKFMHDRPVRRCTVRAWSEGGFCEIEISDTGPGIPDEALPHIFEPFFRAPDATAPGTGIGLTTVKRIVDAAGGELHVESALGEGTTFRLRLPRVREYARHRLMDDESGMWT